MGVTDYDAPRRPVADEDSLEELQARRALAPVSTIDADDSDVDDAYVLPEGELLDEELSVKVVPMQTDEFRCPRCFLVRHRSQRSAGELCIDCA